MNIGTVVVDSSLVMKWVLDEPYSREAAECLEKWREGDVRTVAPGLLPYEVSDALYRRVLKGEISVDDARKGVQAILEAGPVLLDHTSLHAEAISLANELGREIPYCTYYLALAQQENCECWTADRQFWNLAKDRHPRLRWVGEVRTAEETVPEECVPKASDWFSPTVDYMGHCKALFSDPIGFVEGPGKAVVEETGEIWAEMVVEAGSLHTEEPYERGLAAFLRGEEAQKGGDGIRSGSDLFRQNPCTGLEVETTEGTFRTSEVRQYGSEVSSGSGGIRLTFAIRESVFEASTSRTPEYWVLPLINFLSEFQQSAGELERHPLRVYPTPKVPVEYRSVEHGPNEEENKRQLARAAEILGTAYSKDRLIRFGFEGGLGFVERLPDYVERAKTLLEGRERHKTTAVMVGPRSSGRVETFGAMREWFPFDMLSLLTLASGSEVGAPWVEIRDGASGLVRRLHSPLFVKTFRKGRRFIQETSMTDGRDFKQTGRLIEQAVMRSQRFGETFVRIAIVHLVRSAYDDQSLDDSISHLSRGFDLLCKRYGTNKERLGDRLPTPMRDQVREILKDTARRIRELDYTEMNPEAKSALNRIQGKVQNADGSENRFGAAVADLLKIFDLRDAEILQEHYKNRRNDGWAGLLTEARGDVTHNSYLPILEEGRDPAELVAIRDHLHDVLARIIFKILEYDGGYDTRYLPGSGAYSVDWAGPNLSPKALGYPETAPS